MAQGFITQQGDRSTPGSGTQGVPVGAILGGIHATPAGGVGAFTVTELGAFVSAAFGGGGVFQMAIYDLDGGDLDNLIGSTGADSEKTPNTSEQWEEWAGLSITVDGSTTYAICVWPDGSGGLQMQDIAIPGASSIEYNSQDGNQWTWPDLGGVSTNVEQSHAVYAVYEAVGGGLSIPVAMHHLTKNIASGR